MTTSTGSTNSSDNIPYSGSFQKRRCWIKLLSITLIILFALSVVAQVCAILLKGPLSEAAAGIWCGFLYAATGIFGLFQSRSTRQQSDKIRYLTWLSFFSCIASLAMIALAVVSLVSVYQPPSGKNDQVVLWIVANSILVFLGSMGLISCLVLAIGTTMPIHEKQNSEEIIVAALNTASAVQHHLPVAHTDSLASGVYETVESENGSTTTKPTRPAEQVSADPSAIVNETDVAIDVDDIPANNAIYAQPMKKNKSFTNGIDPSESLVQTNSYKVAAGDFDIQLDNRRDSELHRATRKRTFSGIGFFLNNAAEEPINSDDDEANLRSRNIELSPDDIIIHSPPTHHTRFNNSFHHRPLQNNSQVVSPVQ